MPGFIFFIKIFGEILEIIDIFLHLDKYLDILAQSYGNWIYLILFFVIFGETGFVITPFLPGDSLLFIVGILSSANILNIYIIYPLLMLAAITGNIVNYNIGKYLGEKILKNNYKIPFLTKENILKTKEFYNKHGGKAIVLSRFLPFFRTFVPFVAGIGNMDSKRFNFYNILGAFLWSSLFILGGYFFGNIPIIKENLTIVIYAIILITILPGVIGYIKHKIK